jgi:hypothetical protein
MRVIILKHGNISTQGFWDECIRGLPSEFRSENIPRNRLGMVIVIPRNKVLIPCGSEYFGRVHSITRNETERNGIPRNYEVLRSS